MYKDLNTYEKLCNMLDFNTGGGLVSQNLKCEDYRQSEAFKYIREKTEAHAAFFQNSSSGNASIPLIYFHTLEQYDRQAIAKMHKRCWNMGDAPLLFIVLPDRVLIFNNFNPPKILHDELDYKEGLIDTLYLFSELESERRIIRSYHRAEFETGNFWIKNGDRFNINTRVDKTLLENLKVMRRYFLDKGLTTQVTHSLLGRAIFIQYLEDRKDKDGNCAFPNNFFDHFLQGATTFSDILKDRVATYRLFDSLFEKFNGDVFPISTEESQLITQSHLDLLHDFITGTSDLSSGQLALWPMYTFEIIPIQLISDIYEQFFHFNLDSQTNIEKNQKLGTHYTPFYLVEFLLDEILPWEGQYTQVKILDPACGSGIFLVEAYRRLIARWKQSNPQSKLTVSILIKILTENIFGVDSNSEAIRIASFSLCLALCDYLEPRNIWEKVRFPSLKNVNLFTSDFFSPTEDFTHSRYDLIIGNPPWESKLSPAAQVYIAKNHKQIGDKQIAQAFLWKVPELCKENGKICLLVTSKGLLFNSSDKNKKFRKAFFEEFHISTIINFSSLRKVLFQRAVGPAAAVFYAPTRPDYDIPVTYCCPKPSHTLQDARGFNIEPFDISFLSREQVIDNGLIWKIAMWGGPRDLQLISNLNNFLKLKELCEINHWVYGEGFKIGNRKDYVPELKELPFIDANNIERYTIDNDQLQPIEETHFERHASTKREIFKGPHLLIKQSPKAGKGFVAAMSRINIVFNQSILGIHCDAQDYEILSMCCFVINSDLAIYVALMTSNRWLVERDELAANEVLAFPMPPIDKSSIFNNVELKEIISLENRSGDSLLARLFSLNEVEIMQIHDTINYTLDYFRFGKNSSATEVPNIDLVNSYSKAVLGVLKNAISEEFSFETSLYVTDGPLCVVSFEIKKRTDSDDNVLKTITCSDDLFKTLIRLDSALIEERSQGVFIRRNLRIYEGRKVYVIKPNQKRYWPQTIALRDADEIYADVASSWRYSE